MLPTVIKTTDEGLKLVPDDLRRASLVWGATLRDHHSDTLPAAFTPIAWHRAIARAAGETAPLIFTALFSQFSELSVQPNRHALGVDLQLREHAMTRRLNWPGPLPLCWWHWC